MSKLFVCVGKKAKNPYSILPERLRVYTIEQLCYYICDRVDVLDERFMQPELVRFISEELGLEQLSQQLAEVIAAQPGQVRREDALSVFCGLILDAACYLDLEKRQAVKDTLCENERLPVVFRLKKQGDLYAEEKLYYKAQKVYRNLLLRDDVREDAFLKADIYECLGYVATQMFQYETAAYCYNKSCIFFDNKEVRKKYLLCRRFMMPRPKYLEWVSQHEEYYELSVDVEREYELACEEADRAIEAGDITSVEQMKEEYCHMVLE